jgi:hypothetical protein
MAKTKNTSTPDTKLKASYGLHPWKSKVCGDRTEIEAYVIASGRWETILIATQAPGYGHEALAQFIVTAVNELLTGERLMLTALITMQDFLVENDFHPRVEKPVIDLVERIKRTYGIK